MLNTSYEETVLIERWMEHHVTKGMPAYEQRRKDRNYTSRYRLCGAEFETLPCHELRTGEAGHHWLPTADDIHEVWECRVEDPTALWYVSPAPERSPPLKKETPWEQQSTKSCVSDRCHNMDELPGEMVSLAAKQRAITLENCGCHRPVGIATSLSRPARINCTLPPVLPMPHPRRLTPPHPHTKYQPGVSKDCPSRCHHHPGQKKLNHGNTFRNIQNWHWTWRMEG